MADGGSLNGRLLLEEEWGEKTLQRLNLRNTKPVIVHVPKGTLLQAIEQLPRQDGKPSHNYRVCDSSNYTTTLYKADTFTAPLNDYEFSLLSGIKDAATCINFYESGNLAWATDLVEGDTVYCELPQHKSSKCQAIITWKGSFNHSNEIKFGLEIMDPQFAGYGNSNGSPFFQCQPNNGLYLTVDKLSPGPPKSFVRTDYHRRLSDDKEPVKIATTRAFTTVRPALPKKDISHSRSTGNLSYSQMPPMGESIDGLGSAGRHLPDYRNLPNTPPSAGIATDEYPLPDYENFFSIDPTAGNIEIRDYINDDQAPPVLPERTYKNDLMKLDPKRQLPFNVSGQKPALKKGCKVQFASKPIRYGVIRWMGTLSTPAAGSELVAGIELESEMKGCTDGVWLGKRYFECQTGHAFFCPVVRLKPDERDPSDIPPPRPPKSIAPKLPPRLGPKPTASITKLTNPMDVPFKELQDQQVPSVSWYVGIPRGIQGGFKISPSSHLDSCLFALFALSDVFDELFLSSVFRPRTADVSRRAISDEIWTTIVNPLRKNGAVRFESVKNLMARIAELGQLEGFNLDEKNPRGCLDVLFRHALQSPPFVSIRTQFEIEKKHLLQLTIDPGVPLSAYNIFSIGNLLEEMFEREKLHLTEAPSKLIIAMPNTDKQTSKIIPELEINICQLTGNFPKDCIVCGEPSVVRCSDCTQFSQDKAVFYCEICCSLAHNKQNRQSHNVQRVSVSNEELYQLELLSVICFEGDHYVCFTRDRNTASWIYFDGMAEKQHSDKPYNIPKVIDCTKELTDFVYTEQRNMLKFKEPHLLPPLVKKFTCNACICVYVQHDIAMYGARPDIELSQYDLKTFVEVVPTATDEEMYGNVANYKQQEIYTNQSTIFEAKALHEQIAKKDEEIAILQSEAIRLREENKNMKTQVDDLKNQLQVAEEKGKSCSQPDKSVKADEIRKVRSQNTEAWRVPTKRLTIDKALGKGGWGEVRTGTIQVAIKKLHSLIVCKENIDRVHREMRILADVRHPNMIQFIGAVLDQSPPLIITELLDKNLREAYLEDQLLPSDKLPILKDVARALDYLHQRSVPIIHRDVSAPNILLSKDPQDQWIAKVSDLGSANFADVADTMAEGCILYCAPEIVPKAYNIKSERLPQTVKIDVYSYGILLCELTTSQVPKYDVYKEMVDEVQTKYPQVYQLVFRCTKEQAIDRPTMSEILEELNSIDF